jgi:hypothetical protein
LATEHHEPKIAMGTDLKAAIGIALDESLMALEECLGGLSDDQFWAYPLPDRQNIATLVEHSIQILDLFACEVQGSPLTFVPSKRIAAAHRRPAEVRLPARDLPTVEQARQRLGQLRAALRAVLEPLNEAVLRSARAGCWWFEENPGRTRADAYMRAVWHTMSHVRQIWLLRGLLGLTDKAAWPHQHWG